LDRLRRGWTRALVIGACVALVGFVVYAVVAATTTTANPSSGTFPKVPAPSALGAGHRAPSFELSRLGYGTAVSLGNRTLPVVINFFASWCHDCVAELHAFGEVANRSSGVRFVGIDALDPSPKTALKLLHSAHIRYPVGVDRNGNVVDRYLISALPVTFFVSRSGVVAGELFGTATVRALTEWVRYIGGKTSV